MKSSSTRQRRRRVSKEALAESLLVLYKAVDYLGIMQPSGYWCMKCMGQGKGEGEIVHQPWCPILRARESLLGYYEEQGLSSEI
jgi:hypothetical protein